LITLNYKVWCWLKSPWRKRFGIMKLFPEVYYSLFGKKIISDNISICVPYADRKEMLENCFLPAFLNIAKHANLELVIALPEQEKESIETVLKESGINNYCIVPIEMKFTRSYYVNMAIDAATNQAIFICDVDISLPTNLIELYRKQVGLKTAWFPICALTKQDGSFDRFYEEGTGLVGFIKKENEHGQWFDETIKTWGNEDWLFLYKLYENKIYPIRTFEKTMVHNYHPPVEKRNYEKKW